jgi:hypothetical protein
LLEDVVIDVLKSSSASLIISQFGNGQMISQNLYIQSTKIVLPGFGALVEVG